ncbi:MAG: central metabolism, partial [uncultured Thermomicrobiales bacterium]
MRPFRQGECGIGALSAPTGETALFARLPRGRDYHTPRGSLDNSRIRFERRKKGGVAFLGGSITNMAGWRDTVCASLQSRFPRTRFTFINAGIPSLGSAPGAFRLRRDVFRRGEVDLLFVEAAVNDATNHPGDPALWLRGMEGIVRQARRAAPDIDIVMLHFVEPASREAYRAGRTPAVIAAHERVARHYGVPSIDLAREVTDRIAAGQFSWEDDFKDLHPA